MTYGAHSEPCPLCAAPIMWAVDGNAVMVPLDAYPAFGGTMSVVGTRMDGVPMARKATPKLAFGVKLHVIHYTTCKKGALLRKRGYQPNK